MSYCRENRSDRSGRREAYCEVREARARASGGTDFRIGDGRSRIVIETFNGNIEIKRGSTRTNRE
jgi:hypothetical protein